MEFEHLATKTAFDLTNAKSVDYARFIGLQLKFRDDPNSDVIAFRNCSLTYPRSTNVSLFAKAAVAAGTTTDSTWASPLATVRPLAEGFIQLVRASSLIGRLGLRRVPLLNSSFPVETTSASFYWTGEGLPKAMSAGAFGTLSLASAKAAGLITLTDELEKFAQPGNEVGLRDALVKGLQWFVDLEFCDSSLASSSTRPGGLANGSPSSAASGTTEAACATDLKAMVSAFRAVNPSLEDARFIMSPDVAIAIAIATKSTTLRADGGHWYGIPTVTSAAAANRILLVDLSQVVYGDDPAGLVIDTSRVALLQFESAPSNPSVASDILHSLWQRGDRAIRAEYPIRWKLARTDAARVLTGCAYA
jgi:hypothetical protein